jgi:histidyl-tRNA synthetase
MTERFKAMRGTHDILPEEAHLWRRIEDRFVETCRHYGYSEIRVPVFEATELFQRGIGFATDVVQKEMYTFPDKKGRSLSLRPEATPSVVRAYLEHNLARRAGLTKLFYMGPMFRYDRPGAGRYRQFHQLGVEVIGTSSPMADAEVIRLCWEYLTSMGLDRLRIRLNSLGCKACRVRYSQVVKDFLKDKLWGLCDDCNERFQRNPLRVLDCKRKKCKLVIAEAPEVGTILCADCVEHLKQVRDHLEGAGIEFYLDSRLVRGLDYYTRTVFEIVDESAGEDLALGGGGRYDNLVEELGGPSTPAVGFSLGLERIIEALQRGKKEPQEGIAPQVYVAYIGEEASGSAFNLAGRLRERFTVWLEFDQRKLERQLRTASKLGARFTAILGSEEMARGVVRLKDMAAGEQYEIELDQVAGWLAERLGG